MKRMRSMLAVLLCVVLSAALLGACSGAAANEKGESDNNRAASDENAQGEKLSVVTTIFAPYDFVRAITGEQADITMLLPPAAESHTFEPTTKDIFTIQNCDVFIYIGGESDAWVEAVLSSEEIAKAIEDGRMKVVTLMDCVDVVEEEIVEGMQEEEAHTEDEAVHDEHEDEAVHEEGESAHEHEEGEVVYDEHIWTSPKNAKLIVQKISSTLCEADEKNRSLYEQNTASYLAELDQLDADFQAVVEGAARNTVVFGDRFPFRYFTDAYGLTYFAAFPGCSTETEPSAQTVAFLIDKVKAEKIPVVFHAELSNQKMAHTISEATGAKVLLLHACHNISRDDFLGGVTYIDLMKQNVQTLKEALQ